MFWPILAAGYLGLLLSVAFGANQLRVIWRHDSSQNVSLLDFGMRVFYSVLLGIYAGAKGELVFVIANVAAALLSLAIVVVGWRQREKESAQEAGLRSAQREE